MTYEIRKGGQVYCASTTKNLGYGPETLRAMATAGYTLYIDGKRAKRNAAPEQEPPKAAQEKNLFTEYHIPGGKVNG